MHTLKQTYREFLTLTNPYYWQTAVLVAKNTLSKHYKNSFLGMTWTILQPLTQILAFCLIMPLIMRVDAKEYIPHIIASLPLWVFISGTLGSAGFSLLMQGETLKRCVVSSTVFPLADVLKSIYLYLISFATMYGFYVLFTGAIDWHLLLVPLYLIPVFLIIGVASVAMAYLSPYVRDVSELTTVMLNLMFWLTPIAYPATVLPERAMFWMQFNPFFIMLHPIQVLCAQQEIPSMTATLSLLALLAVAVAVCYPIYRICRKNYVFYL